MTLDGTNQVTDPNGQVSEETEPKAEAETTATPETTNAFGLPDDHPAIKELAKVRREAAASREQKNTVRSELQEKAKRWEEYEQSQKTEIERATEKAATLETQLQDLRTKDLRREIADEYKLDADLRELLSGDEDQMKSMAEKLSEKFKTHEPANSGSFLGGQRGNPVIPEERDRHPGAKFLETWI